MTLENIKRNVEDLYPESDAGTRRDLEKLAHSLELFRTAVHGAADRSLAQISAWQLEKAQTKKLAVQRRMRLGWAAVFMLCLAMLVPAVSRYRGQTAQLQQQQEVASAAQQREADAALLDQVTSELSEAVPDSMQPLAGADLGSAGHSGGTQHVEKNDDRN